MTKRILTIAAVVLSLAASRAEASGLGLDLLVWGGLWGSDGACATCPYGGSEAQDSSHGNLIGVGGPGWGAQALGLFNNAGLPELHSQAAAGLPPLDPAVFTPFYDYANSSAQALQRYTYLGLSTATFTIAFTLDALLAGDGEGVDAGMTIYDSLYDPLFNGEAPLGETPHDSRLAQARVTRYAVDVPTGRVNETRSVTFSINPGDFFWVDGFLTTQAFWSDGGSAPGYADAMHTFTAQFTAGDTSLLRPDVAGAPPTPGPTAVPEPATVGMVLTGLSMFLAARRKKSRG